MLGASRKFQGHDESMLQQDPVYIYNGRAYKIDIYQSMHIVLHLRKPMTMRIVLDLGQDELCRGFIEIDLNSEYGTMAPGWGTTPFMGVHMARQYTGDMWHQTARSINMVVTIGPISALGRPLRIQKERGFSDSSIAAMRELIGRMSQQAESLQSSVAGNGIFTQVMREDRDGQVQVCTSGLEAATSDISAVEAWRMLEAERAKRIESEQRVVALEERMDRMQTQIGQLMTLLQRFAESRGRSNPSEPVFRPTPKDVQRDA